jgi:predicted regulator of Ras-like GTPase activity (Roadblock/LC7/MglB family)
MNELSEFGRILRQMVEHTPDVHGAVFTDADGEPIDQYARGPVIEIQIGGAQWGLVRTEVQAALARMRIGGLRSLHIAAERAQVFIRCITHEYFVMLQASPEAHLGKTIANLERACDELAAKM